MTSERKPIDLSRREFAGVVSAGAALAGTVSAPAWAAAAKPLLDLAEWSFFWLGVERASLAHGTVTSGRQMYVEYWVPARVRHPYPIVMVHGGGGQGTDWMSTPDGRRGWALQMVEEGYRVYVVDRPGHGRSPFHPAANGAFPEGITTYEQLANRFSAPEKEAKPYGPAALKHTQWPGTGVMGDPTVDQNISSQGGSFLADLEVTHNIWRQRLAELFDRIGPAFIMTHSMGGPSAWIAGDVRPALVKGMIGIEPAGPPFGNLKYGVTACKMTFDRPVNDASELKTVKVTPPAGSGLDPYFIQEEPARKLVNLQNIPAVIVTSEASYHVPYDAGTVAFLRQAGVKVDHINLPEVGVKGNAHFMMLEKNNREALQPVLNWMKKVEGNAPVTAALPNETGMQLADMTHSWVGVTRKKVSYGTIASGQMFVLGLIPQRVTQPYPIVLVHGGSGQMTQQLGIGSLPGQPAEAGWGHYFAQAGYRTYLIDRPGHGRVPYHPDALGPIGEQPTFEQIDIDLQRSAGGPNKRWPGTGRIGDDIRLDQFVAAQNGRPEDNIATQRIWATSGAELVDRIGPCIIMVHSAGGPFGYLVGAERPGKIKAIVNVEGAMPADPKAVKYENLKGVPIVLVTAEKSGRNPAPALAVLRQNGCDAEDMPLAGKGILGNGHFMMIETNRKEVFDVIHQWLTQKVKA